LRFFLYCQLFKSCSIRLFSQLLIFFCRKRPFLFKSKLITLLFSINHFFVSHFLNYSAEKNLKKFDKRGRTAFYLFWKQTEELDHRNWKGWFCFCINVSPVFSVTLTTLLVKLSCHFLKKMLL